MTTANGAKDRAVNGVIASAYISLANANPGGTGLNEISGITRVAHTYPAASGGTGTDLATTINITVPVGGQVRYWMLWSTVTGGTFLGAELCTSRDFPGGGVYPLDSAAVVHV